MVEREMYQKLERVAQTGAKAIADAALAILGVLAQQAAAQKEKNQKQQIAIEQLYKQVRQGAKMKSVVIPDEEYDAFIKHLDNTNVKNYAVSDLGMDDGKMVFFIDKDSVEVEKAISALRAERGLQTELDKEAFAVYAKDKELSILDNLSEVEVETFRYYALKEELPYAIIEHEDSNYGIMYLSDDQDKVDDVKFNLAGLLSGEQGALIVEQIEYKLRGRQELNIDMADAQREFAIVDKQNPELAVLVTADDFIYYKNNKEIPFLKRTEGGDFAAVYQRLNGLKEPTTMTMDEFKLPVEDRKKILDEKTYVYSTGFTVITDEMERQNDPNLVKARIKNEYVSKFDTYHAGKSYGSIDSVLSDVSKKRDQNRENRSSHTREHGDFEL